MSLTKEDVQSLVKAFPRESVGVKVQSFSKDRSKAMLVLYLQHTDVAARLEEVDPSWEFQVQSETRAGDTVTVRASLSVKGVTRANVGEGDDAKSAHSDALKRCAMLFGVGRYLYDQDMVWVEYNDSKDRFKSWSMDDYEKNRRPSTGAAAAKPAAPKTAQGPAPAAGPRPVGPVKPAAPKPIGSHVYQVPFGRWTGMTLQQIYDKDGPLEITGYIKFIEDEALKKGGSLSSGVAEFIDQASLFLGVKANDAAQGNFGS